MHLENTSFLKGPAPRSSRCDCGHTALHSCRQRLWSCGKSIGTKSSDFLRQSRNILLDDFKMWLSLLKGLLLKSQELTSACEDVDKRERLHTVGGNRSWCSCYGKWASQVVLVVKNAPGNVGDIRDSGLIPGWGRAPGGGHGNPLQYFCLENHLDRGAWWAVVLGVTKSPARLSTLAHIVCLKVAKREGL